MKTLMKLGITLDDDYNILFDLKSNAPKDAIAPLAICRLALELRNPDDPLSEAMCRALSEAVMDKSKAAQGMTNLSWAIGKAEKVQAELEAHHEAM